FQRGRMGRETARAFHHAARLGQQDAATFGQVGAVHALAQQRKAAMRLELAERIADRGNGAAQFLRGGGQAAVVGNGAKGPQMIDKIRVHFKIPERTLPFFSVYRKRNLVLTSDSRSGSEEEPTSKTVWEDSLCAE